MKGLQAAIKLVQNLLDQFEPEDAQMFAAFVLAKVTQDTGLTIQAGMQASIAKWAQLTLSGFTESERTLDSGSCTCGVSCAIRQTGHGPLVMHYGMACAEFKNRFPLGSPTRAQDGVGWNNWHAASEKQDIPAAIVEEDPSKIRFGLLELDDRK